jgi:4-aminobutyrate aminotransferase-like enzyme/Ser/Thr protein kinase RdoA (MazF antagonist)
MSVIRQAPRFDVDEAVRLARDLYGLDAEASALPSERDQNFKLDTPDGCFVLKIANASESRVMLEAQNAAMQQVAARGGVCPRVVSAVDGREIPEVASGHLLRLLTWIPGTPLGSVRHRTPALLEDLGRRVGEIGVALADFDHAAAHRDFRWDLATAFRTIREFLPLVREPEWRSALEQEAEILERRHRPEGLRRSVIHNDANDFNVIVDDRDDPVSRRARVAGIIDFGDLVYSYTAADLAVAVAYVVLDAREPLRAAADVVRGYSAVHALEYSELAQLLDLVRLRLCVSACVAAHQQGERPDDRYLSVSQAPIRRTLPRLARIHPRFAEAVFRAACGISPAPKSDRVTSWLERAEVHSEVIAGQRRAVVVDLSVASPLVDGNPSTQGEQRLTQRIQREIDNAGADVGIGRYLEARHLYSSPLFAGEGEHAEHRTIHLGVDLFAPPGTPVRAPIAGIVHTVAENRAPLDYGPVIILEHETGSGDRFFTLYGHLTRESVARLLRGQTIAAGEPFAAIGDATVNGGWTPHLHFQLIVDLLEMDADFPGVCRASEQSVYSMLSPDPNLLLRLIPEIFPPPDPAPSETLAHRRAHVGRNLSLAYHAPLKIVRGWMQYLYDQTGRRYLDAYNNVPHVGHCHPAVARAAAEQGRVLNTNTRYLHDDLSRLAERLTATLSAPLRVCYFVNSGSEANELALRLARACTGRDEVIVLDAAYHGNTTTLTDMSPYKFNGPGGSGQKPWVHVVPIPDVFRGAYKHGDSKAGPRYADAVGSITHALTQKGSGPAAFIAETCPSVGGQILFPDGYLQTVYAHVRGTGGVCIADEVQTSYGRMGTSFYAFENQHVVPDIVVLGKPIGNGYPLGAVITTDAIAASFDNGMEFFSTFGGSTVSCAVGLAVLEVVQNEQLQTHARRVGDVLLEGLRPLVDRHPIVGDVRGSGLFLGVELVKHRETLEPAAREAEYVVNRMREEGILIGTDGPFHNVLKIRPPMPFNEGDAARLVSTLEDVLRELL